MLFTPEDYQDALPIQAYQASEIKINDTVYTASIIIHRSIILENWQVTHSKHLTLTHLQPLLELEPELILIGTGTHLIFPPHELLRAVMEMGIGIDVMDSAAACRTYNLLLAEGRRVVAGIIIE